MSNLSNFLTFTFTPCVFSVRLRPTRLGVRIHIRVMKCTAWRRGVIRPSITGHVIPNPEVPACTVEKFHERQILSVCHVKGDANFVEKVLGMCVNPTR